MVEGPQGVASDSSAAGLSSYRKGREAVNGTDSIGDNESKDLDGGCCFAPMPVDVSIGPMRGLHWRLGDLDDAVPCGFGVHEAHQP
jgi:hypothetical protein